MRKLKNVVILFIVLGSIACTKKDYIDGDLELEKVKTNTSLLYGKWRMVSMFDEGEPKSLEKIDRTISFPYAYTLGEIVDENSTYPNFNDKFQWKVYSNNKLVIEYNSAYQEVFEYDIKKITNDRLILSGSFTSHCPLSETREMHYVRITDEEQK